MPETQLVYIVELPLFGDGQWFELCACHTPEAAGSVVATVLSNRCQKHSEIRVTVRPRDLYENGG